MLLTKINKLGGVDFNFIIFKYKNKIRVTTTQLQIIIFQKNYRRTGPNWTISVMNGS